MTNRDEALDQAGRHIAQALAILLRLPPDGSVSPRPSTGQGVPQDNGWLTTEDVAARFRQTPEGIRTWRHRGYGPKGIRVGRQVLYAWADVEAWEADQAQEQHGRPAGAIRLPNSPR